MGDHVMTLLVCALSVLSASQLVQLSESSDDSPLTIVENAVSKGAVCLDGTPPAYNLNKGYGKGANDWTFHLEGGAWCSSDDDCIRRSHGGLGSSKHIDLNKFYSGIQSPNKTLNPYFYNWNKAYIRYCDGASFLADVEEPKVVNGTTLYFRGARVFKAIVDDLLEKGMKNATNILFSGNSAGGLANLLHCDYFRSLVPNVPRVKCLADSSFFLHGKDLPAPELRESEVFAIVDYHKLAEQLPKSCTSKMDYHLCLFPEYFAGDIQTPLFMVQSAYDKYQLQCRTKHEMTNISDWWSCYYNISFCTPAEVNGMRDFATTLVEKLPKPPSRGLFVDSCNIHDQILDADKWHRVPEPTLLNKTIAQAVADWFFDRSNFQVIKKTDFPYDCPAPTQ